MQRGFEPAHHVLADAGTGPAGGNLASLPDESLHQLLALPGQLAECGAAQGRAGLDEITGRQGIELVSCLVDVHGASVVTRAPGSNGYPACRRAGRGMTAMTTGMQ
jgi:hypothetical protein